MNNVVQAAASALRCCGTKWLACYALCTLGACCLQGCAVVHIQNQNGSTTVIRRFGLVAIEPGAANSLIQVTSVGLHAAFGVWSLGFGHTEAATVDPRACQMIVWAASAATVQSLRELMGTNGAVCVIKEQSIAGNIKDQS